MLDVLQDVLQDLEEEGCRLVVAGDFNMDLKKGQTAYTRLFRERINEAGYDIHGFGRTFFRLVKNAVWKSDLDWLLTSRAAVRDTWKKENGTEGRKWGNGKSKEASIFCIIGSTALRQLCRRAL